MNMSVGTQRGLEKYLLDICRHETHSQTGDLRREIEKRERQLGKE